MVGRALDFHGPPVRNAREAGANDRVMSGAASADSSGVRSPLRRKLVRTLLKNRGLTTGSLIEGEGEKGRPIRLLAGHSADAGLRPAFRARVEIGNTSAICPREAFVFPASTRAQPREARSAECLWLPLFTSFLCAHCVLGFLCVKPVVIRGGCSD